MNEQRFKLDYEEDDAIFIVEDDDIVYPIRNDTIKEYELQNLVDKLNEQQAIINKQEEIIKSQDMEISRQYNLCLAMSGILREEFGVYDVFDRTKDKNIKKEAD